MKYEVTKEQFESLVEAEKFKVAYKSIKEAEKFKKQISEETNVILAKNADIAERGKKDVEKIKQQIIELNQSLEEQAKDIEAKKNVKSAELKELVDKIAYNVSVIDELKENITKLEADRLRKLDKYNEDIDSKKKEIDASFIKLAELKSLVNHKDETINTLNDYIEAKGKKLNEVENRVIDLNKKQNDIVAKSNKIIDNANKASEKLDECLKEQKALEVKKAERDEFNKQKELLAKEVADFEAFKKETQELKENLAQQVADYRLREEALEGRELSLKRQKKEILQIRDDINGGKR